MSFPISPLKKFLGSTENFVKCYYEWLLAVVNPTKCEMHLLLACSFSSFLIKKEEKSHCDNVSP